MAASAGARFTGRDVVFWSAALYVLWVTCSHATAYQIYCSQSRATWVQAVNSCSQHGGQLVSSPVSKVNNSVQLHTLHLAIDVRQGQEKWLGNYVTLDHRGPSQASYHGPTFLEDHVCGAVKLSHKHGNGPRRYLISERTYMNCSLLIPSLCASNRGVVVIATNTSWIDAQKACSKPDMALFVSNRTSMVISNLGAIDSSLWYRVNDVAALVWQRIPAKRQGQVDNQSPFLCGSVAFDMTSPTMRNCQQRKPYACKFNTSMTTPMGFRDHCNQCQGTSTSRTPYKSSSTSAVPEVGLLSSSTSSIQEPEPEVICPSAATDSSVSSRVSTPRVPTTTGSRETSSSPNVTTSIQSRRNNEQEGLKSNGPGLYIGIVAGVLCVGAVLLAVAVVIRRRRHSSALTAQTKGDEPVQHVNVVKKEKQISPSAHANLAYDANHVTPGTVDQNVYAVPFSAMHPAESSDSRSGGGHVNEYMYMSSHSTTVETVYQPDHYDAIGKSQGVGQGDYGGYDHLGRHGTAHAGKSGQSDNIYNRLEDGAYSTASNRNEGFQASSDVYDHVTSREDSLYSSTCVQPTVPRDPLYDHT